MGVDTTMFACFEATLTRAQVKSFRKWHDEQFADSGFFSTPSAHRHDPLKLTLLRVHFESADPDLDAAFSQFMQALARKSRSRVTVVFDGDGEFDASELEALLERVSDDSLFGDRLDPSDDWTELDLTTGEARTLVEAPVAPARPVDPTTQQWALPSNRELDGAVAKLRNADDQLATVDFEGDLVFTRGADGRLSRLLIRRSMVRRELKPFLEALRGFVREVSVESTDDVEEVRDALELSVRVLGQKNPFFDD